MKTFCNRKVNRLSIKQTNIHEPFINPRTMKKQNIVLVLKIIAGITSACLAVIGAESCD